MGKCPCRTKSVGGTPSQYYPEALFSMEAQVNHLIYSSCFHVMTSLLVTLDPPQILS